MLYPFIVAFREGVEAALIIGIVLAYLMQTGNRDRFAPVWLGAATAVAASLLGGAGLFLTVGELEGPALPVFEGTAMLLAVGILTWMVFWMRQQAVSIRAHLQARVDSALRAGSVAALGLLAFTVVGREGAETVLFLFAGAINSGAPALYATGAALGLAAAVALGYSLYKGAHLLPLRTFFSVTGATLIVLAAGLLGNAIGELQEVNLLPVIVAHVWNTGGALGRQTLLEEIMHALLGYDPSPSLFQVVAYFGYLVLALWYYFRPATPVRSGAPRLVRP